MGVTALLGLSTLGAQPSGSIKAGAPAAGGNSQAVSFTLDSIASAVLQTLQHSQSGGITLDSIQSSGAQTDTHPQTVAYTLGDVSVSANQANTGQASGNSQTIAFTLDSVSIASNQTAQHAQSSSFTLGDIVVASSQVSTHSQSSAITLGDIASSGSQTANHPQALAITLDSLQVAANQSIGSAPKTQTVSIGLDSIGASGQQIAPDKMIQVITGNVQRMRKTYEEEKRKTEEFLTFTETAKPRKAGTITLSQLVGKKAAAQINSIDVEERIQKAQRVKRRQQDDEFMLMM